MWRAGSVRFAQRPTRAAYASFHLIPSIRCLRKELRRAASQISKRFTAPLGTFPSIAGAITRLRNACASFGSAPIPFCVRLQNHPERYVAGELPSLPFPDGSFDPTLVSYFLFAYQERLTCEFQRDSILELMHVTRSEACIYPTITFEAQPSQYIPLPRLNAALQWPKEWVGSPAFA